MRDHDEEARRGSLEKKDVKMDEELIRRQRDGKGSLSAEGRAHKMA